VHEYGGGAYRPSRHVSFRTSPISGSTSRTGRAPSDHGRGRLVTPTSRRRFAIALVAVREQAGQKQNDRRGRTPIGVPQQCSSKARIFYSDPIVSPDGKFPGVAAVDHPNMPWGRHRAVGRGVQSRRQRRLARKGAGGSAIDLPAGVVARTARCSSFGSDGWWNLSMAGLSIEPCIRWTRSSASRSGRSAWYVCVRRRGRIAHVYGRGGVEAGADRSDARRFSRSICRSSPRSIKANGDAILFMAVADRATAICWLFEGA
jgi:hypothetical protein